MHRLQGDNQRRQHLCGARPAPRSSEGPLEEPQPEAQSTLTIDLSNPFPLPLLGQCCFRLKSVRTAGRAGRPGARLVSVASLTVPPHRWRLILFRVLAGLLGLAYLPGVLLFAPWAPLSMTRALPNLSVLIGAWAQARHPDFQRFTWRLSAAVDATIAAVLFALAWRPLAQPLLLQFLALALVVDLCANVPFVPGIIVAYSPILLLLVIYPEPRRLPAPLWQGPIDWSVLTLAVVVGAFFVPDVWRAWQAQVRGGRRTGPQQRLGEHRRTSV